MARVRKSKEQPDAIPGVDANDPLRDFARTLYVKREDGTGNGDSADFFECVERNPVAFEDGDIVGIYELKELRRVQVKTTRRLV